MDYQNFCEGYFGFQVFCTYRCKRKKEKFYCWKPIPEKYGCLFITWFTTMVVNKNVNFQKKVIKIVYTAKNSKIIYYFIEDNRKNGYNKLKKGG